jgi:hypothetical protein
MVQFALGSVHPTSLQTVVVCGHKKAAPVSRGGFFQVEQRRRAAPNLSSLASTNLAFPLST